MTTGLDWCAWHKGSHTDGVRVIHIDYRGPGPDTPVPRSACAPCRWEHNLVPLAYPAFGEQPRTTDTRVRADELRAM